jgi:predicted CopG family antitoxin
VRNVKAMTQTIELSDDLAERLESHCEEDESVPELIEELVSVYETEGAFLQEGYSE